VAVLLLVMRYRCHVGLNIILYYAAGQLDTTIALGENTAFLTASVYCNFDSAGDALRRPQRQANVI